AAPAAAAAPSEAGPAAAAPAAAAPDAATPAAAAPAATPAAAPGEAPRIGRLALPEEIAAWSVAVRPDGQGLPEGQGSAADGEMIFSDHCASCHGEFAEGVDNWPALAGGEGTLTHDRPVKTVGSYWPHLSTVWDYVHRSMPFGSAQTLEADQTYAIVAYILYSNGIVDQDFVLNRDNFDSVVMPNADGFVVDDRETTELPKFTGQPCMENCKESVEITKRAANLDVTPGGSEDADNPDAPKMD
ncbi:c-type cytochrome, partial [Paracoccus panacisoli]